MTIAESYAAATENWRARAEATLRADDGFLTLAGLFWLYEGSNRFGSDPDNEIVLAGVGVPALAGSFVLHEGVVRFEPEPGAPVTLNRQPASTTTLRSSAEGAPDLVQIGDLTLLVHRSGARYAIRVRDRNSLVRQQFAGRRWFAVREEFCVTARFVPYDPPKLLQITNIVGDTTETPSPGYLNFTLGGQAYQLDVSSRSGNGLWLHFHDQTAGVQTYPGGRFLTTSKLEHGQVTLDFNRAVSPPCAFTAFATCPAVLPQNRLPLRIEAGELWSGTNEH